MSQPPIAPALPQTLEAELDVAELAALFRQALTASTAEGGRSLLDFAKSEVRHFARLVGNGRSRSSLAKYTITLRHLTRFVQKNYAADRPLALIDTDFVVAFTAYLRHDRHLADGTVRLYLVALKSWLRQAARQHLLHADPFYGLRLPSASCSVTHASPRRKSTPLSPVKRLLTTPPSSCLAPYLELESQRVAHIVTQNRVITFAKQQYCLRNL